MLRPLSIVGTGIARCCCSMERGVHIADPDSLHSQEDAEIPIWFAAEGNQVKIARLLLDHGASIHATAGNEATPLLNSAARLCNAEMLSLFLKKGADPNSMDSNGDTALTYAVRAAYIGPRAVRIVRILLDAGADPLKQNKAGVSALSLARNQRLGEMVKVLHQVVTNKSTAKPK